jgi:quercetin dioxygenase-like cupin family protein
MSEIQHRELRSITPEQVNPTTTRRLIWGDRLMAALIEFKAGTVVASHQHENEQLTYCISGTMRFTLSDRKIVVRAGQVLLVPGNVEHEAEMPEDTISLELFSPPRQDWISDRGSTPRR